MQLLLPLREEPWPAGPHPFRPCPICGVAWRPWAFSRLPCHARCILSPEDQDALLAENVTERIQAERLGVSTSVIRSNLAAARKRKGLHV